jgi:hypothetical protein
MENPATDASRKWVLKIRTAPTCLELRADAPPGDDRPELRLRFSN